MSTASNGDELADDAALVDRKLAQCGREFDRRSSARPRSTSQRVSGSSRSSSSGVLAAGIVGGADLPEGPERRARRSGRARGRARRARDPAHPARRSRGRAAACASRIDPDVVGVVPGRTRHHRDLVPTLPADGGVEPGTPVPAARAERPRGWRGERIQQQRRRRATVRAIGPAVTRPAQAVHAAERRHAPPRGLEARRDRRSRRGCEWSRRRRTRARTAAGPPRRPPPLPRCCRPTRARCPMGCAPVARRGSRCRTADPNSRRVGLAEADRAGRVEHVDDLVRLLGRRAVGQPASRSRSGLRGAARGPCRRWADPTAAPSAAAPAATSAARCARRIRGHRHEGAEPGVEPRDPLQVVLRQFERRELAAAADARSCSFAVRSCSSDTIRA